MAVVALLAITFWRRQSIRTPEIVRQPVPIQNPSVDVRHPTPVVAPQPTPPPVTPQIPNPATPSNPLATLPPPEPASSAPQKTVLKSVSLHDFLAQLPHHGTVEIRNKRGRFLVIVDNETGETFMSELSPDDQL